MLALLRKLLPARTVPDGQAGHLESVASRQGSESAVQEDEAAAHLNRRNRLAVPAETHMTETLGQKVLHAWLQNRHQTLYPLAISFRNLEAEVAASLARFMAVATLSGPGDSSLRSGPTEHWLRSVGAPDATIAAYVGALTAPPPLSEAVAAVQQCKAEALAYVGALVAIRRRQPAEELFVDYLAARLALPTAVIRSANRRYRS